MTHNIQLMASFRQDGEHWIGSCPDLNVVTQGDTAEEAEANLVEALTLFINTCHKMGTLREVLSEAGLLAETTHRTLPIPLPLPIPVVASRVRAQAG